MDENAVLWEELPQDPREDRRQLSIREGKSDGGIRREGHRDGKPSRSDRFSSFSHPASVS